MSLQMLIVAVVSAGGLAELHATPQEPIGLAVEDHRGERVAQAKSDTTVPGALPGRSQSSEEARRTSRTLKKSKKPAGGERDTKNKEAPPKSERKDPQ
jgi:hypothetical protein